MPFFIHRSLIVKSQQNRIELVTRPGLKQRQGRRELCRLGPEPGLLVQPQGHRPQQRRILRGRIRVCHSHRQRG